MSVTIPLSSHLPPTSTVYKGDKASRPHYDHCPLCISDRIYPSGDNREPVLIFLDMDGVMIFNRDNPVMVDKIFLTMQGLFPKVQRNFSDYHWTIAKAKHLHPDSCHMLMVLIEAIEQAALRPLIVLSTAWRNDATLAQLTEEAFTEPEVKFSQYICGKCAPQDDQTGYTPECEAGFDFCSGAKSRWNIDRLKTRADSIELFIRDHGFCPESTKLLVLDDDGGNGLLEKFGKRFIQIYKFNAQIVKKACETIGIAPPSDL